MDLFIYIFFKDGILSVFRSLILTSNQFYRVEKYKHHKR